MNLVTIQENGRPTHVPAATSTRFAIVTTAAPPSANGQARVLGQIIAPDRFVPPIFLTDQMNIVERDQPTFGQHFELSPPRFHLTTRGWGRLLSKLNNGAGLTHSVLIRADEIVRIVRDNPVDVVIGCSGNPFDLPASCLAARRLNLPFVAYLFDDPVYQWERGIYRSLARVSEQFWGRRAAALIVPNEVLAADVGKRLRRASIKIVRNPSDVEIDTAALSESREPSDAAAGASSVRTLLYTGSVYSAQASAFRNLVQALDTLDGRFTIDVYTGQNESPMFRDELRSPHLTAYPQASHATSIALQKTADLLFLPLAFDSPIPEVIRSSAPAKLGEYLASGRPILVHAPAGSFVTELIREADAGVVVDTSDPKRLADAMHRIAGDAALRQRIVANALVLARQFGVERARNDFHAIMTSIVRAR
jgi:glycosyltransferase involved in cell wall biosynthesis